MTSYESHKEFADGYIVKKIVENSVRDSKILNPVSCYDYLLEGDTDEPSEKIPQQSLQDTWPDKTVATKMGCARRSQIKIDGYITRYLYVEKTNGIVKKSTPTHFKRQI